MPELKLKSIKIVDTDLEYIILDIFIELNVGAGRFLNFDKLEDVWRDTGLRHSDLMRGVDRLLNRQFLTPLERNDILFLMMTKAGENHSKPAFNLQSVKTRMRATKMLRRSRARYYQHKHYPPSDASIEERRKAVRLAGFNSSDTLDLSETGISELLSDMDLDFTDQPY